MLMNLTRDYIKYFSDKNIDSLSAMLTDDFVLEDPVVNRVEGKMSALHAIENIFESCESINFEAKNIFVIENETSIIEFILQIDSTKLKGVDIIIWKNNRIKELRAYLDVPK